jgi:hypothetical protein
MKDSHRYLGISRHDLRYDRVVGDIGRFFLDLPAPFGMIVTLLQPAVTVGAGIASVLAFRRHRMAIAAVLGTLALVAFVGMVAVQIAIDDSIGNVALTIGGPAFFFAVLIIATIRERRQRSLD